MIAPKLYAQVCPPTLAGNLVTNGNFESCVIGNAVSDGFSSEYSYGGTSICPGGNGSVGPGGWSVTSNAPSVNSFFSNPTVPAGFPGGGRFLIIDADGTLNRDAWRSSVNVIAGTTYFFSAWVSNINNTFENPSRLKFSINGVQLGADIIASSTSRDWQQFFVTWVAPISGLVPIRLENLITTSNGNDVAIDEINFSTSCQYIPNLNSLGQSSLLPSIVSTCNGGGSALLDPQLPGTYGFQWKNASFTTLATTPTHTVTTPGRYYLCYSFINGCPRTDTVDVVNTFSLELGPNIELCNPASVTLATGIATPPASITWRRNGTIISGQTGPNLFVNTAGTYRVDVTAPGCAPANDQVVVTNRSVTPVNATYCPTQNVTLSVSPNNGGLYRWWSAATGGTVLQNTGPGGENYTFSASTTTGYTYYVEDASSATGNVGPTSNTGSFQNWQNSNFAVNFTANQDFRLLSVRIPVLVYNTGQVTVTLEVLNGSGGSLSPVRTITSNPVTFTTTHTSTPTLTQFNFSVGNTIQSSWGPNLGLRVNSYNQLAGFNGFVGGWYQSGTYSHPYNSTPSGIVSITSSRTNGNTNANDYHAIFDWRIETGTPCARIPVQAIYNCPTPVDWLYHHAVNQNNSIVIEWATLKEENNRIFIVEKSYDNLFYYPIDSVMGKGNSSSISTYSSVDYEASRSTAYFRIRQIDYSGEENHSPVFSYTPTSSSIVVYPNPVSTHTVVQISLPSEDSYSIEILTTGGQKVWVDTIQGNQYSFNPELSAGYYIVKITSAQLIYTDKILVQ
ncbi:MAG: T9SS type A sorting domain-containing protein [Cytophagaceae bacterium]|nr:T9SS type A sorting domain-containing protein [Cytophagaceae bacterium]